MNFKNLSPEQKKEAAGLCNFFWLAIITTAAWICGLTATGYCSFVKREIIINDATNGTFASLCNYVGDSQCNAMAKNHGVGFYGWQATIPVDQVVCLSYTQYIYSEFMQSYEFKKWSTSTNLEEILTLLVSFRSDRLRDTFFRQQLLHGIFLCIHCRYLWGNCFLHSLACCMLSYFSKASLGALVLLLHCLPFPGIHSTNPPE